MAEHEIQRDQPAHRVAEDDHRQAGMLLGDEVMHRRHVGDHLCAAVRLAEDALRGVGRGGDAMAAMVVGVDVEAARGQEIGEAGVARRMLGKPVIDLDDGAPGPSARRR